MSDPEFGKVIEEGNRRFRECITKKCKMSYKEALKNKTNKCRQSCVAEVCAFVVSRLKEELKKCKDSDNPAKCREKGKKLIRSYSSAYKKVTGKSLREARIHKTDRTQELEEFIQPTRSGTSSESFLNSCLEDLS